MTQPPEPPPRPAPGEIARKLARDAREKADAERRVLSDRLDELDRIVRAQGTSIDVPAHLAGLSDRLSALEASPAAELREPFDWDDVTDPDERAALMEELTTWVDGVLVARYRPRLGRRPLPDGWQEDPLLRDVLTAAWLAWLYAYKNPAARLSEQWTWHRDVLANVGKMLEGASADRTQRERAGGAAR